MTFSANAIPFHFPEESDDDTFFGEDNNLLMLTQQPLISTQSVDQIINLEDKHSDWVAYCASITSGAKYAKGVTDFYVWRRALINQGNLVHLDL